MRRSSSSAEERPSALRRFDQSANQIRTVSGPASFPTNLHLGSEPFLDLFCVPEPEILVDPEFLRCALATLPGAAANSATIIVLRK